jgi:hypothetical protein
MSIIAKLKKNQSTINKAMSWLEKHDTANSERDKADDEGKKVSAIERRCEQTFDNYLHYLSLLPKYEQTRIENYEQI